MGLFKPARQAKQDDSEVICDLDAVINTRAIVILHGKSHVVEPITTGVFAEFFSKIMAFKKDAAKDVKEVNKSYFDTVRVVLPTIEMKDVESLTLPQKAVLIESLAAKVVGNRSLFEKSEKKKLEEGPRTRISLTELIAEGCMIFGWTPNEVLEMRASLFFHMLVKGRTIEKRRKSRDLLSLIKVAQFPHLTEQSQKELTQYFWDESTSELDREQAARITKEMEQKASSAYATGQDVLDVFRSARAH